MNNYEIETKYKADEIDIHDFKLLMIEYGFRDEFKYAESTDYYYWKDETFIRHRIGNGRKSEITVKAKTEQKNNLIRLEENIPVDSAPEIITRVKNMANILGFTNSFEIFKMAQIYKTDSCVIAYYTIYKNKQTYSFLEIEANEGLSQEKALS